MDFNGTSYYTTRHSDEFYVRCSIAREFDISSNAHTVVAPVLDSNANSTVVLDAPSLFSLSTYQDSAYNTTGSSFALGETVYSKLSASMGSMPAGVQWDVNDCVVSFVSDFKCIYRCT